MTLEYFLKLNPSILIENACLAEDLVVCLTLTTRIVSQKSVGDLKNVWQYSVSIVWTREVVNVEVTFLLRAFQSKIQIFLIRSIRSASIDVGFENSTVVFRHAWISLHVHNNAYHDSAQIHLRCEGQI